MPAHTLPRQGRHPRATRLTAATAVPLALAVAVAADNRAYAAACTRPAAMN